MKRILAGILAVVLLLGLMPGSVLAKAEEAKPAVFAGGDGTKENPYLVSTPQQLDAVRQNLSAHYFQINDIDLSGFENWIPIGTQKSMVWNEDTFPQPQPFTGTYNGGNHQITGLKISDEEINISNDCIGLFGGAKDAEFSNIHLKDADIFVFRGDEDYEMLCQTWGPLSLYVGGVCGKSENTAYSACTVSGTITVSEGCDTYAGGIVGMADKVISGCESHAYLDIHTNKMDYDKCSTATVGGIVGYTAGDIAVCANAGELRVASRGIGTAGGIAGFLSSVNIARNISNCVNYGPVRCDSEPYNSYGYKSISRVGGIVGHAETAKTDYHTSTDESVTLKYCINYGSLRAQVMQEKSGTRTDCQTLVGGIIGSAQTTAGFGRGIGLVNLAPNIYTLMVTADNEIKYTEQNGGRISDRNCMTFLGCGSLDSTLLNDMPYTGPENGMEDYANMDTTARTIHGVNRTAQQLLTEEGYHFQGYNDSWRFNFNQYWVIDPAVGGAVLRGTDYTVLTPPTPPTPPAAPVTYVETLYRADQLINGVDGIHQFPSLNVWLTTNGHSPCKALIGAMGDDMFYAAEAWTKMTTAMDTITEGPGKLLSKSIKERDLITAILMEAVLEQTTASANNTLKDLGNAVLEATDSLADILEIKTLKSEDFQKYAKEHQKDILDALNTYIGKTKSNVSTFLNFQDNLDLLGSIIKDANSTADLVKRYMTYMEMVSLNTQTKDALEAMYTACPKDNKEMSAALGYMVSVINAANEDLLRDMIRGDVCFSASMNTCTVMIDVVCDYISANLKVVCPTAAIIFAAYDAEKLLLEWILGTDSRVELYYKMRTVVELENIANTAMRKAIADYQKNTNIQNAGKMLGLVDIKFGLLFCDYREAIRFSELTFDKAFWDKCTLALKKFFEDAKPQNTLKKDLEERQRLANNLYYIVCTSWIDALKTDHPEIADRYEIYRSNMKTRYFTSSLLEVPKHSDSGVEKKLTVKCPVNVSVYDSKGKLIASVVDGSVTGSQDISVLYIQGKKDIYFHKFDNYTVVCEGFDKGTMDLLLTDYLSNGQIAYMGYNQLQVIPGKAYTFTVGNEENTILLDSAQAPVTPDRYTTGANNKEVILTVQNAYLQQATHLFQHQGHPGEAISATAIVPEGYQFLGWEITGGEATIKDKNALTTLIYLEDADVSVQAVIKQQSDPTLPDEQQAEEPEATNTSWMTPTIVALVAIAGIAVVVILIKKRKSGSPSEKQESTDQDIL